MRKSTRHDTSILSDLGEFEVVRRLLVSAPRLIKESKRRQFAVIKVIEHLFSIDPCRYLGEYG